MFCKWCGNTVQPTDRKCSACGRETPPMSDCGGFYNLKHGSSSSPTPTSTPAPPKPVVAPQCPVVEKMEPKYARDRKASKNHHIMTMICFAVVLIAIVCMAILVARMNSRLDEIKELILCIQAEPTVDPTEDIETEPTVDPTEDIETEPTVDPTEDIETEPTVDPTEDIETEPYSFTLGVTVKNTRNTEIGTIYDFGDYAKMAKVTTAVAENEKGQDIAVSYILDGEETAIKLDLVYSKDESENLIIGMKCTSDLSLFDDRDFTYEWQYRKSIGSWTTLEKELVLQDDEDYICFTCNPDWLKNVCVLKQPVELRCSIQIENDSGDSMLLTVDGISIAPDGTIVNNNQ